MKPQAPIHEGINAKNCIDSRVNKIKLMIVLISISSTLFDNCASFLALFASINEILINNLISINEEYYEENYKLAG